MKQELCLGCMESVESEQIGGPCPHCGWSAESLSENPLALSPGAVLNGKYLIGRVLGHGGFGVTYLAWDQNLDLKLAIKEYLPSGLASRATGSQVVTIHTGTARDHFQYGLEKFIEEARALARFVEHAGVVTVRDYFEGNNTAYLVMNYIDGVTFKHYLESRGGRIDCQSAMKIMMPVMDALRELHHSGLLHRDISPENIYITSRGQVKLMDFGAARYATGEHSKSLSVVLKQGYAPEEQYRSRGKQGPWTDVYATAATLYRAITGNVPVESLDRLDEDTLETPSELGCRIPALFQDALMKGLSIRARDRYQTMEEFQKSLILVHPSDSSEVLPPEEKPLVVQQPEVVPETEVKNEPHNNDHGKEQNLLCLNCMTEKKTAGVCPSCGWDDSQEPDEPSGYLRRGTMLNGKYRVRKVMGESDTAITYLAWDMIHNLDRVVKECKYNRKQHDIYDEKSGIRNEIKNKYFLGIKEIFIKESQKCAQIRSHEGIVAVKDCFEENNTAYYVREYVEGETLETYLEQNGGKLNWKNALKIMMPVFDGLQEIHDTGIIHCNINPRHIYITNTGSAKIIPSSFRTTRTMQRLNIGLLNQSVRFSTNFNIYSPFELFKSDEFVMVNQGPWTDVYAVSACLYRTITGERPPEALDRLDGDVMKSPSSMGISLPSHAEAAIMKGLSIRIEDRFQTISEFKESLLKEMGHAVEDQSSVPNQSDKPLKINQKVKSGRGTGHLSNPVIIALALLVMMNGIGVSVWYFYYGSYGTVQTHLPNWVLSPDVKGISAIGSSRVGPDGMQNARIEAAANARDEMARTVMVQLKNMIRNYIEWTNQGDSQVVDTLFIRVSKELSNFDLSGSQIKKVFLDEENNELYVLLVLNDDAANRFTDFVYGHLAAAIDDVVGENRLDEVALKKLIDEEFKPEPEPNDE